MMAPSPAARRVILASGGVMAILRGFYYMPWGEFSVKYLSPVEAWMPLIGWAWVWVIVGILMLLAIVFRVLSIPSLSLFVGMLTMWGVSYTWSWIFDEVSRSWVTGSFFIGMAVVFGVITTLIERRR